MGYTTLNEAFDLHSVSRKFEDNPGFAGVFEILSRPDNIIAMLAASDAEKPALTPCILEIEEYVSSRETGTLDLMDASTKQAIGRLAKAVLAPFGYEPVEPKRLPKELNARFFRMASYYVFNPKAPATMRVVKRIEEI